MISRPRKLTRSHLRLKAVAGLVLTLYAGCPGLVTAFSSPLFGGSPVEEIPILPPNIPQGDSSKSLTGEHQFSLRHIYHHGTYEHPELHVKLDVKPDTRLWVVSEDTGAPEPISEAETSLFALSNPLTIQRLADRRPSVIENYLAFARSSGYAAVLSSSDWLMDELPGPNMTDKNTVLTFARMTANDYIEEPGTGDWDHIGGQFNYSSSFGWQMDGLRGHIYADDTNSTIVISLKGTSPALFDGVETTTNDKLNDNLYFSCCCGQGGSYLWRQVCDCYSSAYTGNLTCITEALFDENRYYRAAIDLYTNVTQLYPEANVWLTGHSLGGAMSSLLAQTFGLPAVTFEAIPEALPAARLGLPAPPGHDPRLPQSRTYTGVYHVGHTADPIYMGTCNGAGSVCTWWGYALESACHTGQMCVYDTVEDKGWRVGIGTHRIKSVIKDVVQAYDQVPVCAREEECYDCELWKFFRSNGSELTTTTTTITTTSATSTTTSTCKTPGWWGCLDESTTTTTTTTTTLVPTTTTFTPTSASSTTTCKTPGWFGCKDLTSTSSTLTATVTPAPSITRTAPTSTATCHDPGWFGCRDPTSTSTTSGPTSGPDFRFSSTCETPGYFWGCYASTTDDHHTITSAPAFQAIP